MFRNYLAAALRNVVQHRLYAAINIVGLSVGFAAALLIAVFVRDELTSDSYFHDAERIYVLGRHFDNPGRPPRIDDYSPSDFAPKLRLDFPAIEHQSARATYSGVSPFWIRVAEIESVQEILWADANFFEILKFRPIAGDLTVALKNPDSIVLTRALARNLFGKDDPRGEVLEVRNGYVEGAFTVTAVIEDLPSNVHISLTAIAAGHAPISPLAQLDAKPLPPTAPAAGILTYLLFPDQNAARALEQELPAFVKRHRQFPREMKWDLQLRPLASLHFAPGVGVKPRGSLETITAVSLIGVLILFAASINFVNLMTARAARRAVEIGVRKLSGAERRHLIGQFIGESMVYVGIGLASGLALAAGLMPKVNAFLGRTMDLSLLSDLPFGAFVGATGIVVGLLAGLYPAFVLAAFHPVAVLKVGSSRSRGSFWLRQSLVVLQFALLIALLISAGVAQSQIDFALAEAQRVDSEEVLIISATSCQSSFRESLASLPGVRAVTCGTGAELNGGGYGAEMGKLGLPSSFGRAELVDPGFFEFYGLTPVAGRFFAADDRDGPATTVINETAVSQLGFASAQAAVGQSFTLAYRTPEPQTVEIIGVVPDFSVDMVHTSRLPLVFQQGDPNGYKINNALGQVVDLGVLSVKLHPDQIPETLAQIDRHWSNAYPTKPIFRTFLAQSIRGRVDDISRQGTVFAIAASIAISIALLGFLGLSAFSAEQRTKEIGIRKSMGANRRDILSLLLWQFVKPVLLANLIAWPAAYFLMQRWLEGFAYRIELAPWIFLAASVLALVIALATVIGHTLLVARAHPVAALRYE